MLSKSPFTQRYLHIPHMHFPNTGCTQGCQFRTVPASDPVRSTPLFRTEKNTGRTGQFRAIPGVPAIIEFFFFFFLSFVIFEFLLGQNGNLFALSY